MAAYNKSLYYKVSGFEFSLDRKDLGLVWFEDKH